MLPPYRVLEFCSAWSHDAFINNSVLRGGDVEV